MRFTQQKWRFYWIIIVIDMVGTTPYLLYANSTNSMATNGGESLGGKTSVKRSVDDSFDVHIVGMV